MRSKKNIVSRLAQLLVLIIVVSTIVRQETWNKDTAVISADVRGYYAYLPALFIYDDLKFEDLSVYDSHIGQLVWVNEDEKGTRFIKYTCGMSAMYAPFFLIAHNLSETFGYNADGFSAPYKIAILVSSVFYLLIGMIFLSRFLRLHFKDHIVASVLLILFLATNAFHYYTGDAAYSHGYSFALISVFMYGTARWLTTRSLRYVFLTGISFGLVVLIRPIDLIFALFPLLYGIGNVSDLKQRGAFFWKNKLQVLLMICVFLLVISPQLFYFKYISGSFLFYSYTGESFFFGNPQFWNSLFSYRNGWLIYSPVMIFSLIGFFFMWRKKEKLAMVTLFLFLIYAYVIVSWWCWWYVGFGNRAFINLYPLLSIPLAYLIYFITQSRWWITSTFYLSICGFILLNLFQEHQFMTGILHWGAMTKEAYWDAFGRESFSQYSEYYLRYPVNEKVLEGVNAVHEPVIDTVSIDYHTFDNTLVCDSAHIQAIQSSIVHHGTGALYAPKTDFAFTFSAPIDSNATHVHGEAWVKCDQEIKLIIAKGQPPYLFDAVGEVSATDGDWKRLKIYTPIPENMPDDSIDIYFWNEHLAPLWVDDLKLIWTKESTIIREVK